MYIAFNVLAHTVYASAESYLYQDPSASPPIRRVLSMYAAPLTCVEGEKIHKEYGILIRGVFEIHNRNRPEQ